MSRRIPRINVRKPAYKDEENLGDSDPDCDTSSDDESDVENPYICRALDSRLSKYFLVALLLLLGFSYLNERDMRLKLMIESLNNSRLQQSNQNLPDALKESPAECPECADCSEGSQVADMPADFQVLYTDWKSKYDRLTIQVQQLSRVLLLQKFGKPPYFVQLNVQVTNDEDFQLPSTSLEGTLLFKLDAVQHMPYATYFFLSLISTGVWNSCSFFISLGVTYLGEARGADSCDISKFASSALPDYGIGEFLAFQEYSSAYPHEEKTIGLSGRPGGMGFYISGQNNTKALQPKGKYIPGAPPLEGDPCIGELADGKDFFIKLKRIEHTTEEQNRERLMQDIAKFEKYITIKSATVVQKQ